MNKNMAPALQLKMAVSGKMTKIPLSHFAPQDASGKCVYCNHCKPCPVGLDIGLINKYYDLAKAGDVLAVEHYKTLEKNAADCIGCGHCDSRCPFKVLHCRSISGLDEKRI